MKSVVLDTNIYGELVVDVELDKIRQGITRNASPIIFGVSVIRKEPRATPQRLKQRGINLRIDLLRLYDQITNDRVLETTMETEELADNYFKVYRELGGPFGKKEMKNDLLIVACASLKRMDIVISNDDATMKAENALRAYNIVNSVKGIHNPEFINYKKFKELLR